MRLEVDVLQEQIRALQKEIANVKTELTQAQGRLQAQVAAASQNSSVTNLVDNSDFSFSESGYRAFAYANSDKSLAHWYRLTNNSTAQITENTTGAASTNHLNYDATYESTPPTASWWSKTTGTVVWRKDDAILTPLPKNYAVPGDTLYVRLSAKLRNRVPVSGNNNAPLAADVRIRCGIWENTSPAKFAQGAALAAPTLTRSAAASAGAFTRHYILMAQDQFGNFASSADTTISIDVSAASIDASKYITVTWDEVRGVSQYVLYRSENGTDWFQVAVVGNGISRADDKGGTSKMVSAPTASQKFAAQYISPRLSFTDDFISIAARIKIPSTYPFLSAASGKQWLRIDLVNAAGIVQTLDTAEIELDRILLATSAGRWTPSASDNNATTNVEVTEPPPPYDPNPSYDPYGDGYGYGYGYGGGYYYY